MMQPEQQTRLDEITMECWDKLCAAESYEESKQILDEFKALFEAIKITNQLQ
jgi:hypothetical protein